MVLILEKREDDGFRPWLYIHSNGFVRLSVGVGRKFPVFRLLDQSYALTGGPEPLLN